MMWSRCLLFLLLAIGFSDDLAQSQTSIALIDPAQANGGWTSDFGGEFPGAKVNLSLAAERFRDSPVLKLQGDFRAGGNYVQASIALPPVDVESISFWVKLPRGSQSFGIRLIDSQQQCNQLTLNVQPSGAWQKIELPVDAFFASMESGNGLAIVKNYEKWGGPNEAKWHQPGKLFVIMTNTQHGTEPEVLISQALLKTLPPKILSQQEIHLDDNWHADVIDWRLNLGAEFPGAEGDLKISPAVADERRADDPSEAEKHLQFSGDFRQGGQYVGMVRQTDELKGQRLLEIRCRIRTADTRKIGLRLVDQTGQCHQGSIDVQPDQQWHDVVIRPETIAGGQHWGGANDGQWHGQLSLMEMMLSPAASVEKFSSFELANVRALVESEATVGQRIDEDFESATLLEKAWQIRGQVKLVAVSKLDPVSEIAGDPKTGPTGQCLELARSADQIRDFCGAASEGFAVQEGVWDFRCDAKYKLFSPDNSYHCAIHLEVFAADGAKISTLELSSLFAEQDWQPQRRQIQIPPSATKARFRIQLNKTYGQCFLDNLQLQQVIFFGEAPKVQQILIQGDAMGNLFRVSQPIRFSIQVQSNPALQSSEQQAAVEVRDYWGALISQPAAVALSRINQESDVFHYQTEIQIDPASIETGKYYQLLVTIPQLKSNPQTEFSGFAVLPVSSTKAFPADQIPFTIRNWDGRIGDYLHLADRLGLRQMGLWGTWDSQAPYPADAPQHALVQELGNVWLTGTPAAAVEREGFTEFSEESLRAGMQNFLLKYKDKSLHAIAIGNEPHGSGQVVQDNVRAYRAIYETAKAIAPEIEIIGTSVEPNEEYFQAGYQNYLDAYDFHVYEHYENVRHTLRQYKSLMQKYNAIKPIHSTELGLNSQGQTRLAVSREMIKKFAVFFAEGGKTASWFNILYPDPDGNARGTSGDAHNMFDCKYSLYNPRLDAITHFHLLDKLSNKTFRQELQTSDGSQLFHFSDQEHNHCLLLWNDQLETQIDLPVSGAPKVELTYVDGGHNSITVFDEKVWLGLGQDPLILSFHSTDFQLSPPLPSAVKVFDFPATYAAGAPLAFAVQHPPDMTIAMVASKENQVSQQTQGDRTTVTLLPLAWPKTDTLRLRLQGHRQNQVCGEIVLQSTRQAD